MLIKAVAYPERNVVHRGGAAMHNWVLTKRKALHP